MFNSSSYGRHVAIISLSVYMWVGPRTAYALYVSESHFVTTVIVVAVLSVGYELWLKKQLSIDRPKQLSTDVQYHIALSLVVIGQYSKLIMCLIIKKQLKKVMFFYVFLIVVCDCYRLKLYAKMIKCQPGRKSGMRLLFIYIYIYIYIYLDR